MVAFQKSRKDALFLMPLKIRRINHQPCFKNGLHDGVEKQPIVTAAVEIKDPKPSVPCPIQIAVADIPLHGVARFMFQRKDL